MAEHRLDFGNLQSNSDAARNTNYANPIEKKDTSEPEEPKTPLEKVVTGEVVKKKKLKIFGADIVEIGKGLLDDVVKPRIKDFAYDFVDSGMSRLLWNDGSRPRGNYRSGYVGTPRTPYSSAYSGRSVPNQQPTGPRTLSRQEREEFNFSEYSFAERVDAERVMDMLQAQIDQEGNASVADFYGLIGVDTQYQDHKWGWTDNGELRNMTIRPNHGAYIIVMPQPVPLNVTGIRH